MYSISAVIITYNEEDNIARCLDSVKAVADEVIVLDSFSTDRTVEIAKNKGAIVRQNYFLGYTQQKNAAISFAANDYILSLDADEALDEALVQSILAAKRDLPAGAYSMNRCTNYCGKYIRNGTWYPDRKIRLFDKNLARWGGVNGHDKIELQDLSLRVQHLKGDILHYSFPNMDEQQKKNNKYSSMSALAMHKRGKKSSWFKILVNPFWAFLHGFIIRGGFRDGFYGFVISINTAHGTFLKYTKLYQLQHSKKFKNNKAYQMEPGKKMPATLNTPGDLVPRRQQA